MRSRIVVLLVLAGVLAGCLGSPTSRTSTSRDDGAPEVVRDPDNYTYVDNASFETGGHIHDYWGGDDELTVIDRSDQVGFQGLLRDEERERVAVFRPRPGQTIPQGTSTVRVTIDWEHRYGGSIYEDPKLLVRTAEDHTFRTVGDLEPGGTVTIESTNGANDLPHRRLSAWAFGISIRPVAAGTTYFNADVSVTVVAERGLELPVFPAHPDHWDGRSELTLLDEARDPFAWTPQTGSCANCGKTRQHDPADGSIVPFDAAMVRVELSPTSDSPTRVGLAYHGADTWNFTRLDPDETDGRSRIYEIPVTPEIADGPYNEQSLWRFRPYITDPVEDGLYAGSYELSAVAVRSVGQG